MLNQALLTKHRWLVFLLPFAVFVLAGVLERGPERSGSAPSILYAYYPLVYTLKIALTLAAIVLVWPGYRQFPLRLSPWAMIVGTAGVFIWIGLCLLQRRWLESMHPPAWLADFGARPAYDPFQQLAGHPAAAWGFLAVRLLGLAAVAPLVEEFFLRGFVMRFVIQAKWWEVPFGRLTAAAVVAGVVLPALYHPPTELLAVLAWFGLVTWLMAKTRNIWDCVAAHAVTNLLLGIYVLAAAQLATPQWWLW